MRTVLPLFTCLPATILAFGVQFYDGADKTCTQSPVGQYWGSAPTTCQSTFLKPSPSAGTNATVAAPGGGYNVKITQIEGRDDQSDGVAFYGANGCAYDIIAFANVNTCFGAGNYASFKVVTLDQAAQDNQYIREADACVNLPVDAVEPLDDYKPKHRKRLWHTDPNCQTSPSSTPQKPKKRSNVDEPAHLEKKAIEGENDAVDEEATLKKKDVVKPRTANPGSLTHGDVEEINGALYKFHQLSARAFRGIPVDEWSDELHKRNAFQAPTNTAPRKSPQRRGRSLAARAQSAPKPPFKFEKRDLNGVCTFTKTCAIKNPESANFPISIIQDEMFDAIAEHNPAGFDWDFLRTDPFVVEARSIHTNATEGRIMISAEIHTYSYEAPAKCTSNGGQRGSIVDMVRMGVADTPITDLKVDMSVPNDAGQGGPARWVSLVVSTRGPKAKKFDDNLFRPICMGVTINT